MVAELFNQAAVACLAMALVTALVIAAREISEDILEILDVEEVE